MPSQVQSTSLDHWIAREVTNSLKYKASDIQEFDRRSEVCLLDLKLAV